MNLVKWKKILVFSSQAPQGERYHISRPFLVLLLCAAGAMIIAGVAGILYAISLAKAYSWQKTEIERLQEENQEQQFKILGFAKRISLLDDEMERIDNFHAKFKILAQKDLKGKAASVNRAGGSSRMTTSASILPENDLKLQVEKMYLELEELRTQSLHHHKKMYEMEDFLESPQSPIASLAGVPGLPGLTGLAGLWPTSGSIMSNFGYRLSPFSGRRRMHDGIDISTRIGTPVRATGDGVVIYRGWEGDYGNTILLDHGHGLVSKYAHLSRIHVTHGEFVHRGDIIGNVGTTGAATGPHLHYEVKVNGVPVNPKKYLLD